MKISRLWIPAIFVLSAMSAQAVVNLSGNINNTAPGIIPGFGLFGNVGVVNTSGSGIYLGGGWVLTANHVAGSLPATATFGGVAYPTQAGSWQRITNPTGMGLSTYTDMVVFRLAGSLALPTVDLASLSPALSDNAILVGNGRIQENTSTTWIHTPVAGINNDTWVETPPGSPNREGYETIGTHEVRWGVNDVASVSVQTVNIAGADVRYFTTSFDNPGYANEAQAVTGDSGGGAFIYSGSSWKLAGMMFSVATYENQPGGANSAIVGQQTAIADIASYRNQILAIVPEPSTALLGLLGLLGFCRRRR
ncbi:PEP-CTERM sorting domain-containing protein [Luteolibacter yonseiensis]|uniref:PEP-CTERM sorting domain-containing protein n=1 Tax=Luteolibacter yonseiensis TaxID=1144680 RepID=A0A934R1R3_9BACT|nr:PEP-CTERM sorting domain-containing protein [Luteolibacter yonseiensis]MBK1815351.1 PEP-CTERM sorting domain-containing protein [Luteolibacter yonseiensis]